MKQPAIACATRPAGVLAMLAACAACAPAAAFEMTVFDAPGTPRIAVELTPAPRGGAARSEERAPVVAAPAPAAMQPVAPVGAASRIDADFLRPGEAHAVAAAGAGGSHRFAAELRRDDLRWSITPLSGAPSPVSELHWEDIGSAGLSWQGDWPLAARWRLEGELGFAGRLTGSVRDSDYDESGRQAEFSRSVSSTEGSSLGALLAGLGWLAAGDGRGATLHLGGGLALHRQVLKIARAEQQVSTASTQFPELEMPPVGTSFDANSNYRLEWAGPYLGLALRWPLAGGVVLGARYRFERLRLKGEGEWSLREDLAQPVSFTQRAWGRVHAAELNLAWPLSARSSIDIGVRHVDGRSNGGDHDMRWADDGGVGLGTTMRLDELRWRSTAVQLGYRLDF